jgi:acetyl-CoA acetyltransferase
MAKPRQEFLGPITKLAAYEYNGSWISDGANIVDGYGSEIRNILGITSSANGEVNIKTNNILNTKFAITLNGLITTHYGLLELNESATSYSMC